MFWVMQRNQHTNGFLCCSVGIFKSLREDEHSSQAKE